MKPGSVIADRYRIESILGSGGMATVYRAFDIRENKAVALKALRNDDSFETSEQARKTERFRNEFEIMSHLDHPGVVKVFEFGIAESGEPYFSMELLEAGTLANFDSLGSVKDRVGLLIELARALAYIHDQGILFCDLKPANVLVRSLEPPAIALTDFGIAKKFQAKDEANGDAKAGIPSEAMTGTSLYMSPEQINGTPLDTRTDIYSFGAMMFEVLTGQPPFNKSSLLWVTSSHLHANVPSMHAISASILARLDTAATVCLQKEREYRYPNMQELITSLERSYQEIDIKRSLVSRSLRKLCAFFFQDRR